MNISFNKPHFTGNEIKYIEDAVKSMHISGDGKFTKKCHEFLENRYGFAKVLLTTSCTDALEMAAILIDIQPGDEVILPSFTFVSTANAFVLRGAKLVFVDSLSQHPNMDVSTIEPLITSKTRAIVPVHYAGSACNMDGIMELAGKHSLYVIEDAAQAIDSFYKDRPLGSFGHLAAFSFHETKNIISGEGGMLVVNDNRFLKRAEIIREKGTNRSQFYRGEVDKYGWMDIGSSYLPSDMIAAFLFAQLENLDVIQKFLDIPDFATNNGHLFALISKSLEERTSLLNYMRLQGVFPVFHYLSLHNSPFYEAKHDGRQLPNCDRFADTLLRLPFYYDLSDQDIERVASLIIDFYNGK